MGEYGYGGYYAEGARYADEWLHEEPRAQERIASYAWTARRKAKNPDTRPDKRAYLLGYARRLREVCR